MSAFSSWGPTDDGRVKPDVVANGIMIGFFPAQSIPRQTDDSVGFV